MPPTPQDPELRDALGAARATLAEWAEEGVEVWETDAEQAAAGVTAEPPVRAAAPVAEPRAEATTQAPPAPSPPAAPSGGGSASLEAVRAEIGDCTRCRLHEGRTQIVFGDGNPDADLLFIGEGPGQNEDERGIPFCGRAGELLTSMIEKGLEIPRSSVYICNIVKCRPPGNRTPLADEVATCRGFLDGQIAAIRPKVIVSLGKPATSTLLGRDVAITKLRGTWQDYRGTPLMPTFHPAFLLRQYTPENRRKVWEDLKAALARSHEV